MVARAEEPDDEEPGAAAADQTLPSPEPQLPIPLLIVGPRGLAAGLVAAVQSERQHYAASAVHPASPAQLLKDFHQHAPRIAVLDVELCHAFGMDALRTLRRAVPNMTWLAAWTVPTVGSLEVLIEGRMRGAIAWSDPPARVVRALEAVRFGEMWFPRPVMQALFSMSSYRGEAQASQPRETAPHPDAGVLLTPRERAVVELARKGLTNKEIAQQLQICPDTVKKHLASAFEKLHLHKRRQIVIWECPNFCVRSGLIELAVG